MERLLRWAQAPCTAKEAASGKRGPANRVIQEKEKKKNKKQHEEEKEFNEFLEKGRLRKVKGLARGFRTLEQFLVTLANEGEEKLLNRLKLKPLERVRLRRVMKTLHLEKIVQDHAEKKKEAEDYSPRSARSEMPELEMHHSHG